MAQLLPRLPRVEALLGKRLGDLEAADMDRMVATRVREETDIDFKREIYTDNDKGYTDAATDIAMANGPGGAVFLGIDDDDGAAVKVTPVPFSEKVELGIRQAVIARTAPAPQFVMHRIPTGSDEGVYLIAVQASTYAPHAVRSGVRLSYPKRSGAHTRWLAESEVADAYRSRYLTAGERQKRLDVLDANAHGLLTPERVWLSTSIVPAVTGSFMIGRRSMNELRDASKRWVESGYGGKMFWDYPRVEAATGRVVLPAGRETRTRHSTSGHAECYSDGCVLAASPVADLETDPVGKRRFATVDVEMLVKAAVVTVAFGAWFAGTRAGAVGDAYAKASLLSGLAETIELVNFWPGYRQRFDEGRPLSGAVSSTISLNLDEATTPQGQLVAARMLLTEIVQSFGLPEVMQITEDGRIRRLYTSLANRPAVESWAKANDIEMIDTTLEAEA